MIKTISLVLLVAGMFLAVAALNKLPSTTAAQAAEAGGTAKPKELVLDLGDKLTLKLVQIPAGKFTMGSPRDEEGRAADETPHEVTISRAFWVQTTEVTQEQYEQVVGENPSKTKGRNLPVEWVNPKEAEEFCRQLSTQTGRKVRLPTEAEWEYACRAGTPGAFAGPLKEMGWYEDNSDGKTHAVGGLKPNAWGLYDMHGNVWEWCADWYGDYPAGPCTDPAGSDKAAKRVLRGGGFDGTASDCRSASRLADFGRRESAGFRVVVEQDE